MAIDQAAVISGREGCMHHHSSEKVQRTIGLGRGILCSGGESCWRRTTRTTVSRNGDLPPPEPQLAAVAVRSPELAMHPWRCTPQCSLSAEHQWPPIWQGLSPRMPCPSSCRHRPSHGCQVAREGCCAETSDPRQRQKAGPCRGARTLGPLRHCQVAGELPGACSRTICTWARSTGSCVSEHRLPPPSQLLRLGPISCNHVHSAPRERSFPRAARPGRRQMR